MTSECSGDHQGRGGGVRGDMTGRHVFMVRSITIKIGTKCHWLDCGGGRNPTMLS